jgi:hypothetical protein
VHYSFYCFEQVQAQIVAGEPISAAGWIVPGDLASQSSDFQINFTLAACGPASSPLTSLQPTPTTVSPQITFQIIATRAI